MSHQRPHDSCHFAGHRINHFISAMIFLQSRYHLGRLFGQSHYTSSSVDNQFSRVTIASFTYTPNFYFSSTSLMSWSDPRKAANCRPFLKAFALPSVDIIAVTVSTATPGICINFCQSGCVLAQLFKSFLIC